jgi:hypothetical protein
MVTLRCLLSFCLLWSRAVPYPDFFYPDDPSDLAIACVDYRKHVMDGGLVHKLPPKKPHS